MTSKIDDLDLERPSDRAMNVGKLPIAAKSPTNSSAMVGVLISPNMDDHDPLAERFSCGSNISTNETKACILEYTFYTR